MKAYEKPRLVALSLSGNDMLCLNCEVNPKDNAALNDMINTFFGGILEGVFGTTESACSNQVSGYCKFTGGQEGFTLVMTS